MSIKVPVYLQTALILGLIPRKQVLTKHNEAEGCF